MIHRLSSILSAYGIALADIVVENQLPESVVFTDEATGRINDRLKVLSVKGSEQLADQGFSHSQVEHELFLNMRYSGSDTMLMVPQPNNPSQTFADAFIKRHHREFGFTQPRDILVEDIRVRSVGRTMDIAPSSPFAHLATLKPVYINQAHAKRVQKVYFEGTKWTVCPVYNLWELSKASRIKGPAMIIDKTQTIVLDHFSEATVLPEHVFLEVTDANKKPMGTDFVDPIALSVFGHRFMSVAEQVSPEI